MVVFGSLCCNLAAPAQETGPSRGWVFQPPPGWSVSEAPDAVALTPAGSGSGPNRILLFAPEQTSDTLAQWFTSAVEQRASALRGFRPGGAARQTRTSAGTPTLALTGQGTTSAGQHVIVSFVGMLNGSGQGLLMQAQFDQLGALRNLRAYGAFVKTLEPAPASAHEPSPPQVGITREAPSATPGVRTPAQSNSTAQMSTDTGFSEGAQAAPQPNGHDLYDWFGSMYTAIMPGPNFTISQSLVWTFYRFFPNGYVYEGLPAGLDPATIQCPAVVKGGKCKPYTLSGSTLTIQGEKPHTFARDGSGIRIDGTLNNRVRRAEQPLSGQWKTSSGGGVLTTVTLSQHLLTLRPDGTFSIQGSTGVSGANVAGYSSSGDSGRYKLNGYTVEFDYNNGRVLRQSFLLPYPDDKVFLIGEAMYFIPTR